MALVGPERRLGLARNKLHAVASGIIVCIIAACPLNCNESIMTKDKADRQVDLDLSQMERVLRESLAAHAEELKGMLTGVEVFAGPREQVDANTWRVGQWTITRSPGGFWATVSSDIYRSDRELEVFLVLVKVDRRDDGLSVAHWSSQIKTMTRIEPDK
jgi:hypothetical protein